MDLRTCRHPVCGRTSAFERSGSAIADGDHLQPGSKPKAQARPSRALEQADSSRAHTPSHEESDHVTAIILSLFGILLAAGTALIAVQGWQILEQTEHATADLAAADQANVDQIKNILEIR
jgi:hypothetical protein